MFYREDGLPVQRLMMHIRHQLPVLHTLGIISTMGNKYVITHNVYVIHECGVHTSMPVRSEVVVNRYFVQKRSIGRHFHV